MGVAGEGAGAGAGAGALSSRPGARNGNVGDHPRRETEREATARNLAGIGCGDFTALVCRPDADRGGVAEFKTAARARFAAEGRVIVANIGDQESDLVGGHAERTFKLPGPFYLTR